MHCSKEELQNPYVRRNQAKYTTTDSQRFLYQHWAQAGLNLLLTSQIGLLHPPHLQHISQVCFEQRCPRHSKDMVFGQLGVLNLHVHFVFMDILAFQVLIKTSVTDRFVKGLFPMLRRMIIIRTISVTIF